MSTLATSIVSETSAEMLSLITSFSEKMLQVRLKILSVIGPSTRSRMSDKRSLGLFRRLLHPFFSRGILRRGKRSERRADVSELEDAGSYYPRLCSVTGWNNVFLGSAKDVAIERSRLVAICELRARIYNRKVRWAGTQLSMCSTKDGKVVNLSKFPRMAAYLRKNKKRSFQVAGESYQSKDWWRTIDKACTPIGMRHRNC